MPQRLSTVVPVQQENLSRDCVCRVFTAVSGLSYHNVHGTCPARATQLCVGHGGACISKAPAALQLLQSARCMAAALGWQEMYWPAGVRQLKSAHATISVSV